MTRFFCWRNTFALMISLVLIVLEIVPVYAAEGGTEGTGSVLLPTVKEEIVSVVLPTVGEISPFDFIIDPQGLIYETGAAKYGGGSVEEGANLLFHNYRVENYDFSRNSDMLTVTNKSTVPVKVRITARIADIENLMMDQDGVFDDDTLAIYLAVVDDEGNESPLSEDGEVVIEIEMKKAPSGAYIYRYNEENDTYEYSGTDNGEIEFDRYSFGLRGACNTAANWENISVSPKVTVMWEVEPLLSGRAKSEEEGKNEKIGSDDGSEDDESVGIMQDDETDPSKGTEENDIKTNETIETLDDTKAPINPSVESTDSGETTEIELDTVERSENHTDQRDSEETNIDAAESGNY